MTRKPTVAEMIAFLQTLPQHAEVQCMSEETSGYSTFGSFGAVDFEECRVFDFSDTMKHPEMGGRIIVEIRGV